MVRTRARPLVVGNLVKPLEVDSLVQQSTEASHAQLSVVDNLVARSTEVSLAAQWTAGNHVRPLVEASLVRPLKAHRFAVT